MSLRAFPRFHGIVEKEMKHSAWKALIALDAIFTGASWAELMANGSFMGVCTKRIGGTSLRPA